MRDISTDDLIQTLIIKTRALERAECIHKLHPTAANARALPARTRDQRNAVRALNIHFRDCLRTVTSIYRPTRRGLKRVK